MVDAIAAFPLESHLIHHQGIKTAYPKYFAPERCVRPQTIDKALQLCNSRFHYSRPEIALKQVFLDDELMLTFHGQRYALTEKAFEDICHLVNVPVRFAKDIPNDLVATIMERLKVLHQHTVVPIHQDDVVVGLVDPRKWTHSRAKESRPHYVPVTNAQLLRVIGNHWADSKAVPHITIADSGMSIEVLHSRQTIEPKVGDVTCVGLAITNSETGGASPQARGYTLRLVCTNGATLPKTFGLIRLSTDWRVNLDRRLATFEAELRDLRVDLKRLRVAYDRLAVERLTDHAFYNLYRQVRYLYRYFPNRELLADKTLGVPEDSRQQIVSQVRRRQKELREGASTAHFPHPTQLAAWDIFNSITATARTENYQPRRLALERLAGDLLLPYIPREPNPVKNTLFPGHPQLPEPELPDEPIAAALNPAPATPSPQPSSDVAADETEAALALEAVETPQPILKRTNGYTIDSFPKGLGSVLNLQQTGFWGKLSQSPANPDFTATDIPQSIWTADPWLGCLFGTSCRFCYVPSLATRIYPGGRQSYWYQRWGNWLLYKPDFTNRLRKQLLDAAGQTRPPFQGAAIYYSPKTDPLIPIPDALRITARNLDVFLDADIFLIIQTRSPKVAEVGDDKNPDIFTRILELARRKKVGVSFSISTDLLAQQQRIESGGLIPEERLAIMARLKSAGVFVSAAVAPVMPFSPDFARKLVDSCHHASIQGLHLTGAGAATPKVVLTQTHREIPHYRELDSKLADEIEAVDGEAFSWGVNNKGFIGAFLAARRFYDTG
jgi:DNA repair photolyase